MQRGGRGAGTAGVGRGLAGAGVGRGVAGAGVGTGVAGAGVGRGAAVGRGSGTSAAYGGAGARTASIGRGGYGTAARGAGASTRGRGAASLGARVAALRAQRTPSIASVGSTGGAGAEAGTAGSGLAGGPVRISVPETFPDLPPLRLGASPGSAAVLVLDTSILDISAEDNTATDALVYEFPQDSPEAETARDYGGIFMAVAQMAKETLEASARSVVLQDMVSGQRVSVAFAPGTAPYVIVFSVPDGFVSGEALERATFVALDALRFACGSVVETLHNGNGDGQLDRLFGALLRRYFTPRPAAGAETRVPSPQSLNDLVDTFPTGVRMMNASIELRARFTQFLTGVEGAERTAASAPAAAGDVCILTGAAFYYKEMLLLSHMSKRATLQADTFARLFALFSPQAVGAAVTVHEVPAEFVTHPAAGGGGLARLLVVITVDRFAVTMFMLAKKQANGEYDGFFVGEALRALRRLGTDGLRQAVDRELAISSVKVADELDFALVPKKKDRYERFRKTPNNRPAGGVGGQANPIYATRGETNSLFHYLAYSDVEGGIFVPVTSRPSPAANAVHACIEDCFYRTCMFIRRNFFRRAPLPRDPDDAGLGDGATATSTSAAVATGASGGADAGVAAGGTSAGLKPASEAGVKLMVESDRWWSESPLAAEFWVAGRQFADGREVYVCVGTDAAASVVETAFKIVHASFA